MQIAIEELHEPTAEWLTKMNCGWSVEELKTTMGRSSSPLPTTPKEDTNSKVTPEKEEGISDTRSNSDDEDAVCSESGYEADMNIHQRVFCNQCPLSGPYRAEALFIGCTCCMYTRMRHRGPVTPWG